jgi:HAD superfamily hydrolase (TIGR01549 family)
MQVDAIDTILFDWDGTLVDTAQSTFEAFRKSLDDLGIPVERKLYEQIYSPNWRSMYRAIRLPEEKWQEAEDLWTRYYGQEPPELVQGGQSVLSELSRRGYSLGIVTSGSYARVWREITALGLTDAFRILVCNEDVVNKKPHPEGLEQAMLRMDKRPEICCYVGDSLDDMEMGKRAGIRTIGIISHYPGSDKIRSARPDLCFESIIQLLNHFKALSGFSADSGLLL